MKIALLYICTGRYNQFFDGFYQTCEKYFFADKAEKEYFVWTDNDNLGVGKQNVHIQHKECAGFPADSLFRFEMFMQVEDKLKEFDYIYFFNSNAAFIAPVEEEILPDGSGLAMGIWPDIQNRHPMFFTYERNKKSLAYVAPHKPPYTYYMGGLNGGKSQAYLEMIRELSHNIRVDYNRGIIAKVHDESHINAYLRNHPCKVLGAEFCWPEEWGISDKNKIIFRDKVKVDNYFDKGRKHSFWAKMLKGYKYIKNAIVWYL